MSEVLVSNGSGSVNYTHQEDMEFYDGKVIDVKGCLIRTCSSRKYKSGENILFFYGFTKDLSLDDLHDFFWNELCVIDDISLLHNGQGRTIFRLRTEAWQL